MWIKSIECSNFRNYERLSIEPDKGINFLYGDNAQGKTNILESVYICSTSRSHRGSKDKELIRFGQNEAHIRIFVYKRNDLHKIDIHFKKNSHKGIAIDGIPLKKASEMFGYLNVVMFAPEDLRLVKEGPSERRRFLDKEICQVNPIYMDDLGKYNKVVEQRNKLLKEISHNSSLIDTLDIWDEQLIHYGTAIIKEREKYINETDVICREIHKVLTSGSEEMYLSYEKNTGSDEFGEKLRKSREKDLFTMQTNTGPHRDDMVISVGGIDIRTYGSQGQQRSAAVSLKLSEIDLIRKITGEMPVLLLDDVMSELDSHRQESLLKEISKTQTFITGTGIDDFIKNNLKIGKRFFIKEGKAEEVVRDTEET